MGTERNIKITLEYDGANYFGWQRQPSHVTVQQRLEEAVAAVTQARSTVIGSGRTDTGVHAKAQVANFRTRSHIPGPKFPFALNANLPPDIAVTAAEDAAPDFHARFDAKAKTYRYTLLNAPIRSPLHSPYTYRVWPPLDTAAMQQAAQCLVGEHDFAAFQTEGRPDRSSVRTVTRADFVEHDPIIEFWIEADGSLYNMVRAIIGTLIRTGRHKISPNEFAEILASASRPAAGPTAPAQGLCLMEVKY